MVNVAVIGATGYGGVEVVRLLRVHPRVRLAFLSSESYPGQLMSSVYPHLAGVDLQLRELDLAAVASECQFAFLCLPAGKSLEVTPRLLSAGVRVVDVSPDFRLRDPSLYPIWYGFEHTCPELLAEAAFGLPEWHRDAIAAARLVAAPGCYSTAGLLALTPLVAEGLIDPSDIVADGKSGISGAGRTSLSLRYHHPEATEDVAAYAVNGHRHLPEIVQGLLEIGADEPRVTFVPHLAPMTRGLLMTLYVRLAPGVGLGALRPALERRYADAEFVHVLPEGEWPHTKWAAGTNRCFLAVGAQSTSGRAIIVCAIDNLGKGMSGQMVQCFNLMMGIGEGVGLAASAAYP